MICFCRDVCKHNKWRGRHKRLPFVAEAVSLNPLWKFMWVVESLGRLHNRMAEMKNNLLGNGFVCLLILKT